LRSLLVFGKSNLLRAEDILFRQSDFQQPWRSDSKQLIERYSRCLPVGQIHTRRSGSGKKEDNENPLIGCSSAGNDDIDAPDGGVGDSYTGAGVHTDGGAGN
jgi:hypothetical protein